MSRIISVLPKTVFDFILTDYWMKYEIRITNITITSDFQYHLVMHDDEANRNMNASDLFSKNVKNGNDRRRREKQDTGHIFQSHWNDDRRRWLFSATSSYIWLTADDGFYQKQPIFFDTSVWIGGGWWEETRLNDRFHIFFFFGKWHAREGNFVRIWQLQIDAWQTTVKHHGARLLE